MTFSSFAFDKRIDACVKACGYKVPTPIQSRTIPLILKGYDVMGLARTGTGKTAAFALPILQNLLKRKNTVKSPRVLILAPTRELALQINENFTSFSRNTGIRNSVVMGGVGMAPQIRACASSQIIVACPGRLVQLITEKKVNLSAIDTLVLDEADRMLDMGFMPDIRRILSVLPAKRQNLLFSATMPGPIQTLAERILVAPKTVRIDSVSEVSKVEHTFYKVHDTRKTELLGEIISKAEHKSMLIFTRTKHKAKRLSRSLSARGYSSTFLQGNMSQNQREKALNGFRTGEFNIMVATDIAARGIDCDRITHVINFDMPDTVETFTHRIGRTGRAGRSGTVISMVTRDDISQLRSVQRALNINAELESSEFSDAREDLLGGEQKRSRNTPKANSSRRRGPGNGRSNNGNSARSTRRSGGRSESSSEQRNNGSSGRNNVRSSGRSKGRKQRAA
ncbi:DEAD/DEAH box helicase [Maridesulfovibrio sp.]|uniref:DEAD/DEAH box helicase n=1 Tax=Maridesulfovibrio sp. TaxID=2795000 RepID=UPI002A18CD3E|nr:DEAD/DEAH box helicase [Maridesulfovibrio sp.]